MGHLINPLQFRLGHSILSDRNWPALNKEQYMFCYGIQKDFHDYFKGIFLFKKKLVLKRKHKKRRFFTRNRNSRILFSHCNINFWGFNLNKVLVDVNLFDLRFEAKWDSLFNTKRFQKFILKFSQVFRTVKILRQPSFFRNIKKETVKQFFLILNKQYHKINGTLLSQTTKWVKAYLAKLYQKFFSFFTDSAYLVNKRKLFRKARRYIKKKSATNHIYITSKYKKKQKKYFITNWSKIFLLLNPIIAKSPAKIFKEKNKKQIGNLKKLLLIKKKSLFNFFDLFDVYFKIIAHKFAKKVRRKDLNHFYDLVENDKTNAYLSSIKHDLNFSLSRLSLNKPILSLIPLEDKIRLYKAQAHYYLKNIILKKQELPINRYIRLLPARDLAKKIMTKFARFKKKLTFIENKSNAQTFTKNSYTHASFTFGLKRFIFNTKYMLKLIDEYNIDSVSVFKLFKKTKSLYPYFRFPLKMDPNWIKNLFSSIILEFTLYKNEKKLINKKLIRFIKNNFYKKSHIYRIRRTIKPFKQYVKGKRGNKRYIQRKNWIIHSKNSKIRNNTITPIFNKSINYNKSRNFNNSVIPVNNEDEKKKKKKIRISKYYSIKRFVLLKSFKLRKIQFKNILKNWIMYEGNLWLESVLGRILKGIKSSPQYPLNIYKSKLVLLKGLRKKKVKKQKLLKNLRNKYKVALLNKARNIKSKIRFFNINKFFNKMRLSFKKKIDLKKRDISWNTVMLKRHYFKNKLYLYNKIDNVKFSKVYKELKKTLNFSKAREKFLKGSSLPLIKQHYKQRNRGPKISLPIFEKNQKYKHFESPSLLSNLDPFFTEQRSRVNYHYTLDPFFQKYMKLKEIKSLLVNIAVDLGDQKMITAKFLAFWLKSLFKKGRKLNYVRRTLDRFIRPSCNYISAVSVLFVGRFTRSAYTTNKYYKFGQLNNGELLKKMDYEFIEFSTKFGMCGIKVKMQYKVNLYANRNLANFTTYNFEGSEAKTYKFDENLHVPIIMKYGSKRLFRIKSNLDYKNNISFYQFQ